MQIQILWGHRMQELNTPDDQKEVHLGHASSVQDALGAALSDHAAGASVGIMPYAGLVRPTLPA